MTIQTKNLLCIQTIGPGIPCKQKQKMLVSDVNTEQNKKSIYSISIMCEDSNEIMITSVIFTGILNVLWPLSATT